jgi:hypothetical protein
VSFVIAQRAFRIQFGIHRNRAVPSDHAIKTWVRNFEATGSTLKKKGGSVKTVRTPENIARVTQSGDAQNGVHFFQWPLTLPPFFFSVKPVALKFRTQVLMAWADGTERLR